MRPLIFLYIESRTFSGGLLPLGEPYRRPIYLIEAS